MTVVTVSGLILSLSLTYAEFWITLDVIKDVQGEMLKGDKSGQIFAIVHIGE